MGRTANKGPTRPVGSVLTRGGYWSPSLGARRRKATAQGLLRVLSGAANPCLGAVVRTVQDVRTLTPAETELTARRPASRVTRSRRRRPTLRHGGAARPHARARRRASVTLSAGVRMATVRVRGSPAQQLHGTTARTQIRKARRRDATRRPSPQRGLGLGTLRCARARTNALNHKKKITTAQRPEFPNARVGATLASRSGRASRGVPRFGEQKCGQVPTCRERPALWLGVATVRGLHKCGAVRRPFMENRWRSVHNGSKARS
jgi:hypothetical protein